MKQADLSEKDQKPESQADELPEAMELPKRRPRFGFYREKIRNQTGGTGKNPENQPTGPVQNADLSNAASSRDNNNPGRRLHAFEAAARKAPPAKIPWKYRVHFTGETTHRAYWDVATAFSLIVNLILVGVVLGLAFQIRNLKTTMNSLNAIGNNVLGGLYGNFAKMDQASLNTTIAVDTQIPLNFNLPVSQNTTVVLTSNVAIPKAHIVINTGGVAINSVANVTLPAGTSLPISLNLTIPFQSTIPISLQVPVNIPLNRTDLHQPITGLQTTILPLYCLLNKNAQYPEGTFICAQQNVGTTSTP
ncbi:MAG: hypothetical protein ABSA23_01440 [Anaerolineales bacterium]|jgi:hypothetical protein